MWIFQIATAVSLSYLGLSSGFMTQNFQNPQSFKTRKAIVPKALIAVVDTGVDFDNNPQLKPFEKEVCEISELSYECINSHGIDLVGGTHDMKKFRLPDIELAKYVQEQRLLDLGKTTPDSFKEKFPQEKVERIMHSLLNSHGTIVANIIAKDNPKAKLLSLRAIPDEHFEQPQRAPEYVISEEEFANKDFKTLGEIEKQQLTQILNQVALSFSRNFLLAASYMQKQGVEVANLSYGFSTQDLVPRIIFDAGFDPRPIQKEYTKLFESSLEAYFQEVARLAPDVLFVIAAGNDGLDTENMYPAHVEAKNFIKVAAVDEKNNLEKYSNRGERVDIAACGNTLEPGRSGMTLLKELPGTSFAAPKVARVAALMKDINPNLQPAELIQIINSVAKKVASLKGKVKSGGVLDEDRCLTAAGLSKNYSVKHAIKLALELG